MRLLFVSTMLVFIITVNARSGENSQVVVRAVFINCEPDDRKDITDNDATRFEREELFKHSFLQDCTKKIALTVKIVSEPDKNSGDEYIPVEHVFRGPNKRVRLLDPYVLRLRREIPLQAYKLRRMARESRGTEQETRSRQRFQKPDSNNGLNACVLTESIGSNSSVRLNKRDKRHEHNIVVEDTLIEEKNPRPISNDRLILEYNKNKKNYDNFNEMSRNFPGDQIAPLE